MATAENFATSDNKFLLCNAESLRAFAGQSQAPEKAIPGSNGEHRKELHTILIQGICQLSRSPLWMVSGNFECFHLYFLWNLRWLSLPNPLEIMREGSPDVACKRNRPASMLRAIMISSSSETRMRLSSRERFTMEEIFRSISVSSGFCLALFSGHGDCRKTSDKQQHRNGCKIQVFETCCWKCSNMNYWKRKSHSRPLQKIQIGGQYREYVRTISRRKAGERLESDYCFSTGLPEGLEAVVGIFPPSFGAKYPLTVVHTRYRGTAIHELDFDSAK